MADLFFILVGITAAFFVFLALKELLRGKPKENFCVICVSVSITWIALLFLYWLNVFDNPAIIALLIGMSITGIFYLADSKAKDELKLFRLPFLLALVLIGYSMLKMQYDIIKELIFIILVWIFFMLIYLFKSNEKIKLFVKKVLECCKRW